MLLSLMVTIVRLGELMNREFFTVIGAEGSLVAIYFLGPSGQPLRGYLNGAPAGSKTPIHTRPYGTVSLNGQNYVAFMMRQTMNLYNFNGQVVGSVAAGKRVLCKSSMASIDSPFLKAINFAENVLVDGILWLIQRAPMDMSTLIKNQFFCKRYRLIWELVITSTL